jgi:hypothetical protein
VKRVVPPFVAGSRCTTEMFAFSCHACFVPGIGAGSGNNVSNMGTKKVHYSNEFWKDLIPVFLEKLVLSYEQRLIQEVTLKLELGCL